MDSTLPTLSDSRAVFDTRLALVASEQERFNRFIWSENERLNRLIRNLYLYLLQFEHYSERDLYDRICQEVAEYFRASSCELYLVRYEEEEVAPPGHKVTTIPASPSAREHKLTKWLELTGAYGQGRRALQRRYVRRADRLRYELLLEAPVDTTSMPKMTRMGFISEGPTRYASGYDHRPVRDPDSKAEHSEKPPLRDDSSRQVVWYQDGLHNSFRCNLMAPTIREGRQIDGTRQTPYYRRIGLIKVENRLPHGVAGFGETLRSGTDQSYLFFLEEWRIVALRPYVRDLRESVEQGGSPFFPLNNNVGWRQYFDDHSLGEHYFHQLLQELDQSLKSSHRAPNKDKIVEELSIGYGEFSRWLEQLLECLIRLESWLQHLCYACRLLCGLEGMPSLDNPVPSLFSVYNLRAAYLSLLLDERGQAAENETESDAKVSTKQAPLLYQTVRDALFNCLAAGRAKDRANLGLLERIWIDIQKTERFVAKLSAETLNDPAAIKEFKKWLDVSKIIRSKQLRFEVSELSKKLAPLLDGHLPASEDLPHMIETLDESLNSIRALAEQEADKLVQELCMYRAAAMRAKLGLKDQSGKLHFDISHALKGDLPAWDFQRVLKNEVLDNLERICDQLLNKDYIEPTDYLELRAEESEVRRVSAAVHSILCDNDKATHRHGSACTLPDVYQGTHDDTTNAGCKAARALAAAVMYADSFSPLDEKRLVFIASHVTQVLDNYLLHQARQRGLDLDYNALDVLGLEHFGLELLDTLRSCTRRMEIALIYLLEREAYTAMVAGLRFRSTTGSLKELVERISSRLNARSVHEQDHHTSDAKLSYPLTSILLDHGSSTISTTASDDLEPIVVRVLERIRVSSDPPWPIPPAVDTLRSALAGVEFKPFGLVLDGGNDLAVIKLVLITEPKGRGSVGIRLVVELQRTSLRERDVRALWTAVRTLEHVLRATERAAGD